MSTRLPNGILIFNATKHSLFFWTGEGVFTVPPDESISVHTAYDRKIDLGKYSLLHPIENKTVRGTEIIRRVRETEPEALIIGSVIAARVYRRDVFSVHFLSAHPKYGTNLQLCSSDLFVFSHRRVTKMAYEKKATAQKTAGKDFAKKTPTSASSPITRGGDPRGSGGFENGDGPKFLKIDPNTYVDCTVLCEPEEIISVEQCAIWLEKGVGISPAWVYIGADDPSHELVDVERRYKAYLPVLSDGEVRIFSLSKKGHQDILEIADAVAENGADFRGQNIRIKRTGAGLQTRYQIIGRPTRTDVDEVEEVDIIPALGPLDREGIEKLLCLRLNAKDFDEILERYEGKKITRPLPTTVKEKEAVAAPAKPKKKAKPVIEEDEEDDEEDLSLV